jgi:hypothetical protein
MGRIRGGSPSTDLKTQCTQTKPLLLCEMDENQKKPIVGPTSTNSNRWKITLVNFPRHESLEAGKEVSEKFRKSCLGRKDQPACDRSRAKIWKLGPWEAAVFGVR